MMNRTAAQIFCWLLVAIVLGMARLGWAAKEGDRFKDWTVGCDKLPSGGKEDKNSKERCFIVQTVISNENDKPVLQIAIGYLPQDNKPAIIVTVPIGVSLAPGMGLRVEANDLIKFPFERCLPQACIAGLPLNGKLLEQFKRGSKAQILFHDGKRINAVPISLQGFTAGFEALKP